MGMTGLKASLLAFNIVESYYVFVISFNFHLMESKV